MQTNQTVAALTEGKKVAESTIKKYEMEHIPDLNPMIAKSSTDVDLNRVKTSNNPKRPRYGTQRFQATIQRTVNEVAG